ncbi:MAG: hypothetical protein A2506_00510 [Elusimicrobia bacterium RIFOXYD12_FULL_66_9]|nr:MAG: hypothetical protein A2506_00510 [Elusimicrobia bacterium RIFOXYD12_FULL_66_9]
MLRGLAGDGGVLSPSAGPSEQEPTSVGVPASTTTAKATDWSRLPPQVQPQPLKIAPPPGATPEMHEPVSFAGLAAFADWERGKRVALEAVGGTLKWVRSMGAKCYRFVKQALIDAGILDVPNPQSTGSIGLRAARAKYFTEDVRKNPEILVKMGYRRADISTMTGDDPSVIPDGSILNYAGGCSFADPASGHIELTVSRPTYDEMRLTDPKRVRARAIDSDEVTVCHFSCTGRTMPFIRTYGTDGPPRRVKGSKGKLVTVPGRKACLNLYVPVKPS